MSTNQEQVILIHTMGKVGSSSVKKSFQLYNHKFKIYHTHYLQQNRLKKLIEKQEMLGKGIKGHLQDSQEFSQVFMGGLDQLKRVKIITLVREPISRNISGFFENIEAFFPDFINRYNSGKLNVQEITDCFLDNYGHGTPLTWLNLEIQDLFDIKIFSHEFPKNKGYIIWHKPLNLLLIRLEDINNCFQTAVKDFMNIDDMELQKANLAKDKDYEKAYIQFKKSVILPEDYINKMYDSSYAKHFYSERELSRFTKQWKHEL